MDKKTLEYLMMQRSRSAAHRPGAFESFRASELYCPHCKQAVPVREKLLLVLPTGDRHHYTCTRCGASLADKE